MGCGERGITQTLGALQGLGGVAAVADGLGVSLQVGMQLLAAPAQFGQFGNSAYGVGRSSSSSTRELSVASSVQMTWWRSSRT